MSRNKKIILISLLLVVFICPIYIYITNYIDFITHDKPIGPYESSLNINESKKRKTLVEIFKPTKSIYYSEDNLSSYKINEVWIEKDFNDIKIYQNESHYKYILNVYFKYLTKNDLHKFRLINTISSKYKTLNDFVNNEQFEHPDGHPRVRYLLNKFEDTLKLEVIERNPNDSLNWNTKKIIDTIILIKK